MSFGCNCDFLPCNCGRMMIMGILPCKGGVVGPDAPKIQALPEWGGGSDPCLDFCEGFVHMH